VGSGDAPAGAREVVVVLCGTDAAALGAAAAQLPGRVAVFVGDATVDADRAALVEMVDELFARG
jgi:hypothetical protein